MKDFKWKVEYSTGNEAIDTQHKKLFTTANSAFSVVEPSKKLDKIKKTILLLSQYTGTHFSDEEQYMTSIKYPKLEEHRKIHTHIVSQLSLLIKKIPTMKIGEIERELAYFVQQWIINHIKEEDKKIFAWLNSKA
ncbi:MAG: hemerythrin family protein [Sulfurospirillaceae bacterium]|nr:hemerythrin family protein [Sulfurospirillaceae bacterium]